MSIRTRFLTFLPPREVDYVKESINLRSFGAGRGIGLEFPRPGVHLDGVQCLWGHLAGCRKGLERGQEDVLGGNGVQPPGWAAGIGPNFIMKS